MKSTQFHPMIVTEDVAGTAAFWCDHIRFWPVVREDWFSHLRFSEDARVNLAILQGDAAEGAASACGEGVRIDIAVADFDGLRAGLDDRVAILREVSGDEGRRTFVARDPNGVLIAVSEAGS